MISCLVCGKKLRAVSNTHLRSHGLDCASYKIKFPEALLVSNDTRTKHSARSLRMWNSMADDDREAFVSRRGEIRRSRSAEEKEKTAAKFSATWQAKTEEQKCEIRDKIREGHLRLTSAQLAAKAEKQRKKISERSIEVEKDIRRRRLESYLNRPIEEKQKTSKKHREANLAVHANRTDEERQRINRKNSESNKRKSAQRTPEEMEQLRKKWSAGVRAAYKRKTPEQLVAWFSKIGKSLNTFPNYPERTLLGILSPMGFIYVGDGSFWVKDEQGVMNPDFIRFDDNSVVELYGERFHTQEEWDRRKIRLESKGFTSAMVWCRDLKLGERAVIRKILNQFLSSSCSSLTI